jgi:imidazolonepropionase-like amidohydrolase
LELLSSKKVVPVQSEAPDLGRVPRALREEPVMLAIRAARMFDDLHLHSRPLVLVAGDRITGIDVTGAEPPADRRLIELPGAPLLPGLIIS